MRPIPVPVAIGAGVLLQAIGVGLDDRSAMLAGVLVMLLASAWMLPVVWAKKTPSR